MCRAANTDLKSAKKTVTVRKIFRKQLYGPGFSRTLYQIFAVDKDAKIAIVSADKDYRSVLDYWTPRLSVPNQLVRCKTLAKAISHVNGEGARKTLVNERMKILDLQTEYGRYEERKRIVNEITVLFAGTDYEALISQIVDMVISTDKPKILYLTSLKSFGKKDGTEVYRQIKNSAISV